MTRQPFIAALLLLVLLPLRPPPAQAAPPAPAAKVLRLAFPGAETGFDPA